MKHRIQRFTSKRSKANQQATEYENHQLIENTNQLTVTTERAFAAIVEPDTKIKHFRYLQTRSPSDSRRRSKQENEYINLQYCSSCEKQIELHATTTVSDSWSDEISSFRRRAWNILQRDNEETTFLRKNTF